MTLPRFYPVLDSADWIARVLPLGVRLVQLRAKDRPEGDLRDQIGDRAAVEERDQHGIPRLRG